MRLSVAGCDRTADLGGAISGEATRLAAVRDWSSILRNEESQTSALSLRASRSEKEYLNRLAGLMWARGEIGTGDFYIPRRPGLVGGIFAGAKKILWRLLRYQHHRMAFQQNTVNTQLTAAVEFLRAEYRRELVRLERRIERLERASQK